MTTMMAEVPMPMVTLEQLFPHLANPQPRSLRLVCHITTPDQVAEHGAYSRPTARIRCSGPLEGTSAIILKSVVFEQYAGFTA